MSFKTEATDPASIYPAPAPEVFSSPFDRVRLRGPGYAAYVKKLQEERDLRVAELVENLKAERLVPTSCFDSFPLPPPLSPPLPDSFPLPPPFSAPLADDISDAESDDTVVGIAPSKLSSSLSELIETEGAGRRVIEDERDRDMLIGTESVQRKTFLIKEAESDFKSILLEAAQAKKTLERQAQWNRLRKTIEMLAPPRPTMFQAGYALLAGAAAAAGVRAVGARGQAVLAVTTAGALMAAPLGSTWKRTAVVAGTALAIGAIALVVSPQSAASSLIRSAAATAASTVTMANGVMWATRQ